MIESVRGVRPLLVGALLVGAAIAACSSFEGGAQEVDGGVDAPFDAGFDPLVPDSPFEMPDGGADADDGAPPGMVLVAIGASAPFWIDREEVTGAQFSGFVGVPDSGTSSIPGCSYKDVVGIGPFADCLAGLPVPAGDEPIRCVDWCDAVAYCKFRGKRLCGKVGGGANVPVDEAVASKSQWAQACAGSNLSAERFPYGDGGMAPAICNTDSANVGHPVDVSQFPGCVGALPGLHDMSGNVEEWVDSCTGTASGKNDECVIHGGGYNEQPRACSYSLTATRGDRRAFRGFRCCKDL